MAPGLYKSLNNLAVHTEVIGYLHRFLDQVSLNSLVLDILHRQEGVQTSTCFLQLHRSVEQPALQLQRISDN